MLSVDDLGEGFALTAQTAASIDPKRVCEYMHTALDIAGRRAGSAPRRRCVRLEVLPEAERNRF